VGGASKLIGAMKKKPSYRYEELFRYRGKNPLILQEEIYRHLDQSYDGEHQRKKRRTDLLTRGPQLKKKEHSPLVAREDSIDKESLGNLHKKTTYRFYEKMAKSARSFPTRPKGGPVNSKHAIIYASSTTGKKRNIEENQQ